MAKAPAKDTKDTVSKLGRNSRNIVKFPKEMKIQMGYLKTKAERDLYKRTMLSAIKSSF